MNLEGKINLIKDSVTDIKQAIVDKGQTITGNLSTYADSISAIVTPNNQTKSITSNGTVRYDEGYTGLESVTVNVNQSVQDKTITENGTYMADSGYIGLGTVEVNVDNVNNTSLSVTPSTLAQSFTPSSPYTGYGNVSVSPVTHTIDNKIQSYNIKSGVKILGVNGSVVELNGETIVVRPSTSQQVITPSSGKNAITQVTVNAVSSSIDSNIQSSNIRSGVSILGVNGSLVELKGETISVPLMNKDGETFVPSTGKNGITSITVTPNNRNKSVTPTTSQQTLNIDSGYSGNGTITVGAVTSAIDSNIIASNIKSGISILGVTGTYSGEGNEGLAIKMTSNGTFGGSFFAISSSASNPYLLFDNNDSTYVTFSMGVSFRFYSPIKIKLDKIKAITNGSYSVTPDETYIYGSDNGTSWTSLSFSQGYLDDISGISISTNSAYKYYRFENLPINKKNVYNVILVGTFSE